MHSQSRINTVMSLILWLLLLTASQCLKMSDNYKYNQILAIYVNQTLSNNRRLNLSQKINIICTINKNESNRKSFTSLYIIANNHSIEYYLHNIHNISFYHIINLHDLPSECIKQIKQTKQKTIHPRNSSNLQTNIATNNNINKVFVSDVNKPTLLESTCPTQAWEFFVWSLHEWWLIYVFVVLIGIIIGSLMIIIIVFCCWKSKKKKFVHQIINEYKNRKQLTNVSKCPANKSSSSSLKSNPKYNEKEKTKKHNKKYALVDANDLSTNKNNKNNKKRNHKSTHSLHPKRREKKRRKTLPANTCISDENAHLPQDEEDHLLTLPRAQRMKSNSDPFNPYKKPKKHNKHSKKHHKSIGNLEAHKSRSRSRSPWRDKASPHKYEQYRFTGKGNANHASKHFIEKPKKRKNKKRNRSKSPCNVQAKEEQIQKLKVIVNHIHHHNSGHDHGLPKLPKLPPEIIDIAQPMEIKSTKKSIGINLAKMKARNYEENRREQHNVVIHEGASTSNQNQNNNKHKHKHKHYRNGGVAIDANKSNYMGSLTNINDEGIDVFEHRILDGKINENEEESSSFTVSNDKNDDYKKDNNNKSELELEIVDTKRTKTKTKRYKLPKAITKGQWM